MFTSDNLDISNSNSLHSFFDSTGDKFSQNVVLSPSLMRQSSVIAPAADLVVRDLRGLTDPLMVIAGGTVKIDYTVENQGNLNARSNYTSFYLSKDSLFQSTDTFLGLDAVGAVNQKSFLRETITLKLNNTLAPGNYYIIARGDNYNQVIESEENNNIASLPITVTKPDLIITNITGLGEESATGERLNFTYTIKNQGTATAAASRTRFYLSRDTTIDNSDFTLGFDAVNSLDAGKSSNETVSLWINPGWANFSGGDMYLLMQADNDGRIGENDENNNLITDGIKINIPNLTISSLTAANSVKRANFLDYAYKVKNIGTADSKNILTTSLYLSRDISLDSSDIKLQDNSTALLARGQELSGNNSAFIGSSVGAGNYYLILKVDSQNILSESNEADNTMVRPLTVIESGPFSNVNGYGLVNAAEAVASALKLTTFPNVTNLGGKNWGADLVNAPEVWARGYTGQGVIVAVLDTGVDRTHPDLEANIWTNTGEINGNGIDDDGNGFVDDVYGWNFDGNNNNTIDIHSHGTHVAGTIAAANNDFGVTGIAYNAKIMPVKVVDDWGNGNEKNVAKGVRYAVDNGARVINISLGGDKDVQELREAVEYAGSRGAIVVMAAGNSGRPTMLTNYPSSYAQTRGIAVGAVTSSNILATWSNRAGTVEVPYVTAPGVSIYSTNPKGSYGFKSGTSMATPHVAGVVALMLSANPDLTDGQVRQLLISTAENSLNASAAIFRLFSK